MCTRENSGSRIEVRRLPERGYLRVLEIQHELVEAVAAGRSPPVLLLVEHDPVVTIGRRGARERLESLAGSPALRGRPLVEVERGGGVTVHGPGQIVGYPIVRLAGHDVRGFLESLERGLIAGLAELGLAAGTRDGATGVWVGGHGSSRGRKIASIGIAVRRWVTFHGFALNVSNDLGGFEGLDPCGFEASVMTSLERELGRRVVPADVAEVIARAVVEAIEGSAPRTPRPR